jgi:hypothetical protein
VLCEVAEQLAELAKKNEVEIHFVPSHTEEKIGGIDEIDKLAKNAAEIGDEEVEHDPFVSSYQLVLKKRESATLLKYLKTNVKPSQFTDYSDRAHLKDVKIRMDHENWMEHTFLNIYSSHAQLNKVRTGHTRARVHPKNIGIEQDDKCKNCGKHKETIQHQLINCRKFKKRLKKYQDI